MRRRYSMGGIKKQRGRWVGMWWVDGRRKGRVLGFVNKMSKTQAREAVNHLVAEENAKQQANRTWHFGEFVELVYFPYYSRKWKDSTRENNVNRVSVHLVTAFKDRELAGLRRDELQDLLDLKAKGGLSFSVVDHLRWDMKQVFDMAVAEGHIERNPALLLFTPKEAPKPVRRAMTIREVQMCFAALDQRERLICKLAVLAGMRPGEIFALTWGRLTATYADIRQRVYRGMIDTPKTDQSLRQAALSDGLLAEIENWRLQSIDTSPDAWVFPSEKLTTPLSKDNCWRRYFKPKLESVELSWVNFQVLRKTHSSLLADLDVDPAVRADQMGHTVDVNQNVYTKRSLAHRRQAVNALETALGVM
jgi:integrase